MNSFLRIKLGLRSVLAELPLSTYLVTTFIGLGGLSFFAYLYWSGQLATHPDELLFIEPGAILAVFCSVALFPAFFISVNFFTKRFKDAGRGEDFLLLPLASTERFSLYLIFSWVIVPLITYLPILLLMIATGIMGHSSLVGPSFAHLLWLCSWSVVIYYILSVFWLFPAIAFPKFAVLLVFGLIGFSVAGALLVYSVLPSEPMSYSIDASVFESREVVGMHEVATYGKPVPRTEIDFGHDHEDDNLGSYLSILIASPLFLLAAFRALTRKQA